MAVQTATLPPKFTEILCIGLGLSGVCLGVQLKKRFGSIDMHFYDRNESHSGTWWVNRYPGCACDVPAIFYSYSFEINPDWTRLLPSNYEMQRYLEGVVDKYQLRPHMTFRTECESAKWDSKRQVWTVYLRDLPTREQHVHECRLLFSAVGVLVEPKEPDIPGKESFQGPIFHTGRWRDDIDLKGKDVVMVGNGCSASQAVPEIVPVTKTLTQFIHTPHWLLERDGTNYSPMMRWAFRNIPFVARLVRLQLFLYMEKDEYRMFLGNRTGARLRRAVEKEATKYALRTAPEKYHDILIPEWEVACKRRVFDTDGAYLKSLNAPNLHLTKDPIVEIVPRGIRTANKTYPADAIIFATGFQTNNGLGALRIQGRNGEWLEDHWRKVGGPGAYNSSAVHGFPNFMMIYGPNSTTGYASVIMAIENMVNYSLKIVKPVIKGEASEVEIKEEAEKEYLQRVQEASADKVWNGSCNNWYVTKNGWNSTLYPWSQFHFWWRSTFPIWRDWNYKENALSSSRLGFHKNTSAILFTASVLGAAASVHGIQWWSTIVDFASWLTRDG